MLIAHKDPYRQSLTTAEEELAQLEKQKAAINERIAYLTAVIQHLKPLVEMAPLATVEIGLTDACRQILMRADRSMTAPEVRNKLALLGLDLGRYTNPMAVLHTTLRRIAKVEKRGPATVYIWPAAAECTTPPPGPTGWET